MKELVDSQSKYPVLSITIGFFLAQLIALWLQTAEFVPVAPPPAESVQISAINKKVTPWLITDSQNMELLFMLTGTMSTVTRHSTLMFAHTIVTQQLGSYTVSTFPAAIDGHSIKQVAFTKFVLRCR